MSALTSALREAVDAKVGEGASFGKREEVALELMNEAGRRCLEEDLQGIADRHEEHVLIDDVLHRRHEPGEVTYHSLCGGLVVKRYTYRAVGERNAPTVVAMELEAGLMERATPALAGRICLGYAKTHSRSIEEDLRSSFRVPPSRSTIERIGKGLGKEAQSAVARVEAYVRAGEQVPKEAVAVSIGLDRTSVPMEEDRMPGEPPATRRKKRTKPYERQAPAPVDVNYRMAYVGTVSMTDKDGECLVGRRYAASASEGPQGILRRMVADVRGALRQNPELEVGVMQDGAPEMWNLVRGALDGEPLVDSWREGIDRYHLNKRLGEVLRVVESDEAQRKVQLESWQDDFDTNDATIDDIETWLLDEIACRDGEEVETLNEHATFIDNNKDRMRYAGLREVGLPVGSGVTEGACGTVVGDRAKGKGRRWRPEGLDAAFTLRSIYCSDRMPQFCKHLKSRYTATIRAAA